MNIFENMVIRNGVRYWGKKVNEMCTRKVGDPAEVHTHFLLHSNSPPINTTFVLSAAAVDKLQVPNPHNNMASLIMVKYYLYPKLDKHVDIFTCIEIKVGESNDCMKHQI